MVQMEKPVHPLFLVTSVIALPPPPPRDRRDALHQYYHKSSVFSTEERWQQTRNTIRSIRRHMEPGVNGYDIVILEASDFIFPGEGTPGTPDLDGVHIHRVRDASAILARPKSAGEALILRDFLTSDAFLETFAKRCDIIIKVSGRYELTPDFRLGSHDTGRINVRPKVYPLEFAVNPGGLATVTIMYSWGTLLTKLVLDRLDIAVRRCSDPSRYVDIEQALFYGVPAGVLNELATLGIRGRIAPNGEEVCY